MSKISVDHVPTLTNAEIALDLTIKLWFVLSYDSLKSSGFWKRILHPSNTKLIPLKQQSAGKFITKCYFITLTHTHNRHVGECFNLKPWKSITPPIFVLIVLHNSCVINNIFVSKLLFNTIILFFKWAVFDYWQVTLKYLTANSFNSFHTSIIQHLQISCLCL